MRKGDPEYTNHLRHIARNTNMLASDVDDIFKEASEHRAESDAITQKNINSGDLTVAYWHSGFTEGLRRALVICGADENTVSLCYSLYLTEFLRRQND